MKYSRLILVIAILISIVSLAYGDKCYWWVVSSSGEVFDSLGARRGSTLGQTSIGRAQDRYDTLKANYGFWNDMFDSVEICINVTDSFWNVGSLGLFETKAMADGEFILVENCGNCHLNFGLEYDRDLLGWAIGSTPGPNKFTLRAQFTNRSSAPITYNPFMDFVKDELIWSTENIFGPEGYDVSISSTVNLWFLILMPNARSVYGNNVVVINLSGKSRLP